VDPPEVIGLHLRAPHFYPNPNSYPYPWALSNARPFLEQSMLAQLDTLFGNGTLAGRDAGEDFYY